MIRVADLRSLVCPAEISIREVMTRIGRSRYLFQMIVDGSGRLLGTVTDGDIRRVVLRGLGLEQPVTECMQRQPTIGRAAADADAENLRKLAGLDGAVAFLPLVDESGAVTAVLIDTERPTADVAALVMAGGAGRRLGEATKNMPKPLLSVGGKPLIEHVLERLEESGVNKIYVAVHYLSEQVEDFVVARRGAARIHILRESKPLGTAGAIGLLPSLTAPLLVLNGDVITKVALSSLLNFHRAHGLDGTIAAAQYQVQIPFGVIRHGEDGQFLGMDEKPRTSHFVAAGIYVLAPEFRPLVPPDTYMDMPELLNLARGIGFRLGLFPIHEYWTDLGRPADLSAARQHFGDGPQ
jgi:GTP:adenosylcobinamide-phosphate guanylyltransferase